MNRPRHPLSVLVVDAFADAADSTATLLALHGYPVRTAYCGEDALAAAATAPPDVVLASLFLPGMDGCELARRLIAAAVGKRPFLVALTGCAADDERRWSAAAGFDLHMVKPVEPAVLVGVLERFGRVLARREPGGGPGEPPADPDDGPRGGPDPRELPARVPVSAQVSVSSATRPTATGTPPHERQKVWVVRP